MNRTIATAAALVGALLLGTLPAGAHEESAPQITDPAGDANGINAQGNGPVGESGPDTRPASVDGADIRSISFETPYTSEKVYGTDGTTVLFVLHRPSGVNVKVAMEGNVLPTPGPSMLFRVPVAINGCETWIQGWWRGPNPPTADPQRADLRKITATCPGAAATFQSPGFSISIVDKVVTLSYPFTALTGPMAGFIQNGTEIGSAPTYLNSANYPHVRTVFQTAQGPGLFPVSLDETLRHPGFTVGEDVPPDVDCSATPDDPECAA